MMQLDGSDIAVGDRVYDLVYGAGTVREIGDRLRVNFSSIGNRPTSYNSNAIRNGAKVRTLYWHNPVVTTPPKNKAQWDLVQRVAKAASTFGDFDGTEN